MNRGVSSDFSTTADVAWKLMPTHHQIRLL